jgi:NAD(P)H-hydrate epimerase
MADRRPLGFGRRAEDATAAPGSSAVPEGATLLDDDTMARLLPERDKRGHKGEFGKLLVIAGSLDYAGAAFLVCRAAGRAGAGLVTLAVPESLQPLFAAKVVEATTMALPEDDVEEVDPEPALAKILDHDHDALVIGPGLRPALATADLLRLLLTGADDSAAPVVLDAEALRTLAAADGWWTGVRRRCVLTPHAGEFARLRAGSGHDPSEDGDLARDDDARVRAAKAAAAEWGQVLVLKGARTAVAAPDGRVAVAPFENPAMASGGTGDVLAGMIGALLAQGLASFDAARLGVYLHGLAGEAVRERIGDAGLLAGDLPDLVPMGRKRLAVIAERLAKGRRLGFGARESSDAPGGAAEPGSSEPSETPAPADSPGSAAAPAAPAAAEAEAGSDDGHAPAGDVPGAAG